VTGKTPQRSELPLTGAQIAAVVERHVAAGAKDVTAVWIFGSMARGPTRADSDVDLAFLVPRRPSDPVQVFEAAEELAVAFGRDVDLIDLAAASDVLRAQVVAGGHRIHTTDERVAEEFEMYALSDYARLNEERREIMERFADRYRA
jgi:predicted nucleotidyltransferase